MSRQPEPGSGEPVGSAPHRTRMTRSVFLTVIPVVNGVLLIVQGVLESEPFDVAFPPATYVVVNGAVLVTAALGKIISLISVQVAVLDWGGSADTDAVSVIVGDEQGITMEPTQTGVSVSALDGGDTAPPPRP